MTYSFTEKKRIRNSFSSKKSVEQELDLLAIQIDSFNEFIQSGVKNKQECGLHAVLKSFFPITANNGYAEIDYIDYSLEKPRFSIAECKSRGVTYAAILRVKLKLILFDKEGSILKKKRKVKQVIEDEVYMSTMPIMTNTGTFVVNGTERVVVSQLHRSPGVIFEHDKGKTHSSGKTLFSSRIIPYRGSWLDFEFDHHDHIYMRIDRRRKLLITKLLHAMGYDDSVILAMFYESIDVKLRAKTCDISLDLANLQGVISDFNIKHNNKLLIEKGRRINARHIKALKKTNITVKSELSYLITKVIAKDVVDKSTGELLITANTIINEDILQKLKDKKIKNISILDVNDVNSGAYISDTLRIDDTKTELEAKVAIYHVMRPGEPTTEEAVNSLFKNLFFSGTRYNLSKVGRMKINRSLGLSNTKDSMFLSSEDIINVINKLIDIKNGLDTVDDIDTLANRRVRAIGEMIENQFRIGLSRIEKTVKESLNLAETDELTPQDIINSKPISAAIQEFFLSSQLSQFMDQINPLSGITHKRRISALGPGGLTRDRAGFEVRDVHPSHYGKLCPIETPEGPNIGLISTLAVYAKINKYGFLETPYQVVKKGKITNKVKYISVIDENDEVIAQASAKVDSKDNLVEDLVSCRHKNEFILASKKNVTLIDINSKQITSVAAALIPFLEHDDANRALMGSNMQRQAVPLIRSEKPLVGTGIESVVAKDSRVCVVAKNTGVVEIVDSSRIVVRTIDAKENLGVDIYNLTKYVRSNQNTCINQKVLVKAGDEIKAGDILADGPSTDLGELALGQNMLIAFMPWNGYNFEDSILVSEKVVQDDRYTTVHIEELTAYARDTKLGAEEITADIPNVSENALLKLDDVGVIYIGARVKSGDILVGKVTPKTDQALSPEEKLLRAIFGEKAANVKDTSLRMSSSSSGVVIDVQIFTRDKVEKDSRAKSIDKNRIEKIRKDIDDEFGIIKKYIHRLIRDKLATQVVAKNTKTLKKGTKLTAEILKKLSDNELASITVTNEVINQEVNRLFKNIKIKEKEFEEFLKAELQKNRDGAELPPGVLKMIRVYVATRKQLQVGDKMAGRHGNKGVISRVLPVEDMPYLEDGTTVDIVLNPLGVPSRMNVGQVLETHLGWAAHGLGNKIAQILSAKRKEMLQDLRDMLHKIYNSYGKKENIEQLTDDEIIELSNNLRNGVPMATPVFDGIKEQEVKQLLKLAKLPESGQTDLYDGRTGEKFDRPVTVGYMYMLKLNHLVDDKMHARSTGPYSLVTQQPLSGKSQFGGQRFGEMEVWALEAYGAAHNLREILTVKSDDISGRAKMYKNIVDGNYEVETFMPESFNVLLKEIKALGIDIELE